MLYLVRKIEINNNEPFEMNVPVWAAEDEHISKAYIRPYVFYNVSITFDFELLDDDFIYRRLSTESRCYQPFNINNVDNSVADDKVKVEVLPMLKNATIAEISAKELLDAEDETQAIYDFLRYYLEIDFLVTRL